MKPDSPLLDLAQRATWFGLQPGMTRAAALEVLRQQAGIEIDDADAEWVTAERDDWEMDLWFTADEEQRLWQLSLVADGLTWNGQPLHEAKLDAALQAMEPLGPAMWTARHAIDYAERPEPPAAPASDALLLRRGTLWLAERRLGLVMSNGCVEGVVWREARDFPRQFAGPLTEAQRTLSHRADLTEYLDELPSSTPREPRPLATRLATALFAAAVAAVIVLGVRESIRGNEAILIQGRIAAREQVPFKAFRDFVPPALQWLFPKPAPRMVDGFRLAYTDPMGQPGELMAAQGDFVVYSYEIGQEVPIAWLAGPPPQARTYYRVRDAGFLSYVPWVIALALLYALVLLALALLRVLARRMVKTAPPGS